jgi:hypothetical protein
MILMMEKITTDVTSIAPVYRHRGNDYNRAFLHHRPGRLMPILPFGEPIRKSLACGVADV